MTLIAGFRSYGTPVLIGDLLTSNQAGPVGLRKKIVLIRDNFAVAWTGYLIAAGSVIRSLQSALNPGNVSLEDVKQVLTDPATSDLGDMEVRLIGWVVDPHGEQCFLWNSLNPKELFSGEPQYDGSGELTARAIAGTNGLYHPSPPSHVDPHEVNRGVLGVTTQLMHYELWGPSTKQWGFGHAYEILRLVDGQYFKYLDNTLYMPIGFELDENGGYLRSKFGLSFFKYHVQGNCSIFHSHDPATGHQDIHVLEPPGLVLEEANEATKKLSQGILNREYSYPLESDYYCCVYQLRSPNFLSPPYCSVIAKEEMQWGGIKINIDKQNVSVGISREWAEWSYKVIREDQEKNRPS